MPAAPSLLIVPARFKTGKLYTQIATTSAGLVLGSSGDFNVTRATTATRFNSAGLIESVASGVPRLDYFTSGGTAGCPALLVEPSAQNVVVQSQNWLASGWRADASGNVTTVSSTTGTLDPLGTNTANAISPTVASGTHFKVGSDGTAIYTSGTIYTFTGFFKQGTGIAGRYVQITSPAAPFTQQFYANFDLQLGTITATGSVSADTNRAASIENYGNEWYRCRITTTCNVATTSVGFVANLITASGDFRGPSFTGVTGDVLYGWGAQLETGSVATSYIPTTAAAVTRNADVVSLSGAVSGCIGQTEGTLYAEVVISNTPSTFRSIFEINDGTGSANNRIILRINSNGNFDFLVVTSGDIVCNFNTLAATTGTYKMAFAYQQNNFAAYVNGNLYGSDSSGALSSISYSTALCGHGDGNIHYFNDRIRAAALYTTRLTNAELAALTTL
jgi:hypothetical protein